MQVNWAGNWEDKETGEFDLLHYPYNVLKEFQKNEYQNYVLAEFKRLPINLMLVMLKQHISQH